MDDFKAKFQELIQRSASAEEWLLLSAGLGPGAYGAVLEILDVTSNVQERRESYSGLKILVKNSSSFRAELADALRSAPLPAMWILRNILSVVMDVVDPALIETRLYSALLNCFAYKEPNPIGNSDTGDRLRAYLNSAKNAYAERKLSEWVPALHLSLTQKSSNDLFLRTNWEASQVGRLTEEENNFLRNIPDLIQDAIFRSNVIENINWEDQVENDVFVSETAVTIFALQKLLLECRHHPLLNADAKAMCKEYLLQLLDRTITLWSSSFENWEDSHTWTKSFSYEDWLRAFVKNLESTTSRDGLFDSAQTSFIMQWIQLTGGWSSSGEQSGEPSPSWMRSWNEAARTSRELPIIEAIPIHTYVRLMARLRNLSDEGNSSEEPNSALYDTRRLGHQLSELTNLVTSFGLCSNVDWDTGVLTNASESPNVNYSTHLFEQLSHSRSAQLSMHMDIARMSEIIIAKGFIIRAELAYRDAGLKPILGIGKSTQRQKNQWSISRALYKEASELLSRNNDLRLGLGLFGKILLTEIGELSAECEFQLSRLREGEDGEPQRDFAEVTGNWSVGDGWDSLGRVEQLISTIRSLEAYSFQRSEVLDTYTTAFESAQDRVARSELILRQANENLEVERLKYSGIEIEIKAQSARIAVAEYRIAAFDYQAMAAAYASSEADALQAAEDKLNEAKERVLQQISEQISNLKSQLDELSEDIPERKEQLKIAKENLRNLVEQAYANHKKESTNWFVAILKSVASVVSIYFTGVDLVRVAEAVYNSYECARRGDWEGAVLSAYDAANTLSKDKLKKWLKEKADLAQDYISSFMVDSLDSVNSFAVKISSQLNIPLEDATKEALNGVAKQALRVGASYLCEKAHLEKFLDDFGLQPSEAERKTLEEEAATVVLKCAYDSIAEQGEEVKQKFMDYWRITTDDQLKVNLEIKLKDGAEKLQEYLIEGINEVKKNGGEADIDRLKAALLIGRDELVKSLSQKLNRPAKEVKKVLEKVGDRIAIAEGSLPPGAKLPEPVVRLITQYQVEVDEFKKSVGFLADKKQVSKLINQLAEIESDSAFQEQLTTVSEELQGKLEVGQNKLTQSLATITSLQAALDQGLKDQMMAQYSAEEQDWRTKAAQFNSEQKKALRDSVMQSGLATKQESEIEHLRLRQLQEALRAQERIIEIQSLKIEEAQASKRIDENALQLESNRLSRWKATNVSISAQKKIWADELRIKLLDQANSQLLQSWRLINLFEPIDNGTFQPDFSPKDLSSLEVAVQVIKNAEREWNQTLLANFSCLSSIDINRIKEAFLQAEGQALYDKLRSSFTSIERSHCPPLELKGASDLKKLRGGITFCIDSLSKNGVRKEENATSILDPRAGISTEVDRVEGWNDEPCYRMRLIGVLMEVTNAQMYSNGLYFYLSQESNPWMKISTNQGAEKYITLPIARTNAYKPEGTALPDGHFINKPFQTRPLFGYYTLRITPSTYDIISTVSAENFHAKLHFISVGIPN